MPFRLPCLPVLVLALISLSAVIASAQEDQIDLAVPPAIQAGVDPETAPLEVQQEQAPLLTVSRPRTQPKAQPSPEDLFLAKDPQPTFSPDTADLTADAARAYLAIVEAGGWPQVPADAKLTPGTTAPAVQLLRHRLAISGDLDAAATESALYDADVEAAVKHFQERHGFEQTGAIGPQTLRALNVSAIIRYNQLVASAERARAMKFPFGRRYVAVNIPSATAEAVENGAVVQRYLAVVGQIDKPSPVLATKITEININPTWTVPASIVKNEIIPHMRKDPTYLARNRIHILDQAGVEIDPATIDWNSESAVALILRQDSGADNSLGTLRIDMPNKDAVYMHDTPSKRAFGSTFRFLSHGCVRISRVNTLAAWLLEDNIGSSDQPVWTPAMIEAAITIGKQVNIKLEKPVPVAWVYLTGYATSDHVVHFRNDIYNRDIAEDASVSVPDNQHLSVSTMNTRNEMRLSGSRVSVPTMVE